MKRASVAELTLQKEVKNLKIKLGVLLTDRNYLNERMGEIQTIISDMESEIFRLEQARKKASEQRKP